MENAIRARTKRTRKTFAEKLRQKRKILFLAALGKRGVVQHACEETGTPRQTVYDWYERDEDFARAWDVAVDISTEIAESECFRRAVEGFDHPVIYEGEITDHFKKYSDANLRLLLQSRKPDQYRDRQEIVHGGGLNIVWDLPTPSASSSQAS